MYVQPPLTMNWWPPDHFRNLVGFPVSFRQTTSVASVPSAMPGESVTNFCVPVCRIKTLNYLCILFHIISYIIIITLCLHGTHTRCGENRKLYNSILDTVWYYILVCKRFSLCIVSRYGSIDFFNQNFLLSFSAPIIMLDELSQVRWYVRCVLSDQAIVLLTKSFIPDGWVSTYTFGMYVWYSIRKWCSVKLWLVHIA